MPLYGMLVLIFTWLTRFMIFQVLQTIFVGFLGIVSYVFVQRLIDRYVNAFLSELMNTDIGFIMNISRLDDAISIIVGALTICGAIKALGLKITSFGAG